MAQVKTENSFAPFFRMPKFIKRALPFAAFLMLPTSFQAEAKPGLDHHIKTDYYKPSKPVAKQAKKSSSKRSLTRRAKEVINMVAAPSEMDPYFAIMEQASGVPAMHWKIKAAVESNLNPKAGNKKSSARGMWQFIKTTGRMCGLEVSRKKDERFDPYLSSLAATRYMCYNLERSKGRFFSSKKGVGAIGRYYGVGMKGQKEYEALQKMVYDHFGLPHEIAVESFASVKYNSRSQKLYVVDEEKNAYLAGLLPKQEIKPLQSLPGNELMVDRPVLVQADNVLVQTTLADTRQDFKQPESGRNVAVNETAASVSPASAQNAKAQIDQAAQQKQTKRHFSANGDDVSNSYWTSTNTAFTEVKYHYAAAAQSPQYRYQ